MCQFPQLTRVEAWTPAQRFTQKQGWSDSPNWKTLPKSKKTLQTLELNFGYLLIFFSTSHYVHNPSPRCMSLGNGPPEEGCGQVVRGRTALTYLPLSFFLHSNLWHKKGTILILVLEMEKLRLRKSPFDVSSLLSWRVILLPVSVLCEIFLFWGFGIRLKLSNEPLLILPLHWLHCYRFQWPFQGRKYIFF